MNKSKAASLFLVAFNGMCVGLDIADHRYALALVNGALAVWLSWQLMTYQTLR